MRRLAILVVLVSALALAPAAQAIPITGNIGFGGNGAPVGDPERWDTATGVAFINPWVVTQDSGDYLGLLLTPATFTDFNWGAVSGSTSVPLAQTIWTLTDGEMTYSLTAGTITRVDRLPGSNAISVLGRGELTITGFDPTPGVFSFTGGYAGTSQNLSFSSSPTVPDAGSSLLLLGMGLVGLRMWRKR